jgi:hypothetical protein
LAKLQLAGNDHPFKVFDVGWAPSLDDGSDSIERFLGGRSKHPADVGRVLWMS